MSTSSTRVRETYERNGEVYELIPRGTTIKVMADFSASGVWQCGDDYAGITAEELGASPDLCRALEEWQDWFDSRAEYDLDFDDLRDFRDLEECRRFDDRGLELARWLKREVGDRYP